VKDFHNENHKTLKKEIKEVTRRWEELSCSWIGRINIVKMVILPKPINRFNVILVKILMSYFAETEKSILKFICKHKRLQIVKKRAAPEAVTILYFKLHYRAIVTKTAWSWHKSRYEDQWNRLKDSKIKPYNYSHVIFDKRARNTREKTAFSTLVLGKLVIYLEKT
jgi:hypothetical protein